MYMTSVDTIYLYRIKYHDHLEQELQTHQKSINRRLIGTFLVFFTVGFFRCQNYIFEKTSCF